MLAVKINAKNDRNGNPRRGWIIFNMDGVQEDFIVEENGISSLESEYPIIAYKATSEIMVSPSEYKSWKKSGGK
jgi:hypothetical protein